VKEEFVLITAETLMNQGAKSFPIGRSKQWLNRLQPAFGSPSEMHCGNTDPHLRLNGVHLKVIDSTGDPELSVITIELREIKFGKTTELSWVKWWVNGVGGWLWVLCRSKLVAGIMVTELGKHVVGVWVDVRRRNREWVRIRRDGRWMNSIWMRLIGRWVGNWVKPRKNG